MQGQIIKIISNKYTVLTDEGTITEAVAMGKLRLGVKPKVGDRVHCEMLEEHWCMQEVLPRKNSLLRPAIANVDQAMIVMSAIKPAFSSLLVDKLVFLISYEDIEPVIVITKMDLVKPDDPIYEYIEDYRRSGYRVILVGHDYELDEVFAALKGKITVMTGQSGVGKSTLLNRLNPELAAATQQISKALGRGKHTTRHSQLYEVAGGWLADTPGFSSLDFSRHDARILREKIRDFAGLPPCRFADCRHINEPDCEVKKGVENGTISKIRYSHYLDVVKECDSRKEWEK